MVLGKLPVPGRPTILITVGQGPTALAVGVGGGCLDIFTLIYPFSPLSPSLWETARYRLKYCLKGPLNPKQPTNQPKSFKWLFAVNWQQRKKKTLKLLFPVYIKTGAVGRVMRLSYFQCRVLCVRIGLGAGCGCSRCGIELFGQFFFPLSFLLS